MSAATCEAIHVKVPCEPPVDLWLEPIQMAGLLAALQGLTEANPLWNGACHLCGGRIVLPGESHDGVGGAEHRPDCIWLLSWRLREELGL